MSYSFWSTVYSSNGVSCMVAPRASLPNLLPRPMRPQHLQTAGRRRGRAVIAARAFSIVSHRGSTSSSSTLCCPLRRLRARATARARARRSRQRPDSACTSGNSPLRRGPAVQGTRTGGPSTRLRSCRCSSSTSIPARTRISTR